MLQISTIKENPQEVVDRLAIKNFDAKDLIVQILNLDEQKREIQKKSEFFLSEGKILDKKIGVLYKSITNEEEKEEIERLIKNRSEIKDKAKELIFQEARKEEERNSLLLQIPNLPHHSIPKGKGAEDNIIISEEGRIPQLDKNALAHWDLAIKYNIIDFETGVKITGSGFPIYKGKGAKLQRALINFFLDNAVANGYLEVQPPFVVNEDSAYGTGQLPDKEGQMYYIGEDNLYLIPTAEVPVTNIYRDMILKAEQLPVKNTAYSACFRREAGSYGKDVRGLNRLHQFDKVEIVQITHPDKSYETLEEMKDYVSGLLRKLELPYKVVKLCGGDMSFASAWTYDMEVYSAAQQKWLEVSSVSNFETFQSNRLKLRFREGNGKPQLAHTLNGSALALPRIVAALLENNQTPGGIKIPKALVEYTGFEIIN